MKYSIYSLLLIFVLFAPLQAAELTEKQVNAKINGEGKTFPAWWKTTPMEHPKSLDLSWPHPAQGGWNNQKNVGQYVWDIVNTNPAKWKSGLKLMYEIASTTKNPSVRQRATREMGRMYYHFFGDYARAAFWYEFAEANKGGMGALNLAECYYKLGSKKMALDLVKKTPLQYQTIKVLADIGELKEALSIANANLKGPRPATVAMYAADACRVAGDFDEALKYYEFVTKVPRPAGRMGMSIARYHERAKACIAGIKLYRNLDLAKVGDGTYSAQGEGYIGPLTVQVTVKQGKITECKVTQNKEDQCYNSLTEIPKRIIEKQGLIGIDAVSSATITSEAILNATGKALAKGQK